MSTPTDRPIDLDDPSPYAPKWARQSLHAERRPVSRGTGDRGFALGGRAVPPANDDMSEPEELVIGNVRVPPSLASRTLDPSPVPDPRMIKRRLRARPSRLRVAARVLMAGTVATAAACYWVGVIPSPGEARTDGALGALAAMLPSAAPEAPVRGERRPLDAALKIQDRAPPVVSEQAAAPAAALPQASVAVQAPAAAQAPEPAPPPRTAEQPAAAAPFAIAALSNPERAAPAQKPAAPAPVVARRLEADEIALLIKRGEEFVEAGDFASARPVLQRAAEGGSAHAALILAGTFDPAVMQKVQARGLAPDIAKAKFWYERARDLGSAEAQKQLARLAER